MIGQSGIESIFEDALRGERRRPQRARRRRRPRGGRARRGAARCRAAASCSRSTSISSGRPETAFAAIVLPNDPLPQGRGRRARRAHRRRARDGLAADLRPERLRRRHRPGDVEGAHRRPVDAAPEPRDPEPVPARARRTRRSSRRPRSHEGVINPHTTRVLPRLLLVRQPRLPLLEARRATARSTVHTRARAARATSSSTRSGVKLGIDRLADFAAAHRARHADRHRLPARGGRRDPEHRRGSSKRFGERWYPGETVSVVDRPGLQPDDAAPARGRLRGARERREAPAAAARAARRVARRRASSRSSRRACAPTCTIDAEHTSRRCCAGSRRWSSEPGGTGGRAQGDRACASAGKTGTVAGGAASSAPKGLAEADIPIKYRDHALVRRVRAGRGAGDRGRGVRRARAARLDAPPRRSRSACCSATSRRPAGPRRCRRRSRPRTRRPRPRARRLRRRPSACEPPPPRRRWETPVPWIDRRSLQHFDWALFGLVLLLVGDRPREPVLRDARGRRRGLPPEFRRQLARARRRARPRCSSRCMVDYRRLERLAGADLRREPRARSRRRSCSRRSRAATDRGSSTARSRSSPPSSRSSGS